MPYPQATYLTSATRLGQCPADEGREVAFVGRSNAGKSSLLNALTRKGLARTSKTPGRTQMINFFSITAQDDTTRLVDLPGYGYAKAPIATQAAWTRFINHYLDKRQSLQGLVLIMDCRHPLKPLDQQMLTWGQAVDLPIHIVLNKADKLSRAQQQRTLNAVRQQLKQGRPSRHLPTVQLCSTTTKLGLADCQQRIAQWLKPQTNTPKLVILDRDGVINYDSDNYIRSPSDWQPIPGSLTAIARLHQAGIPVAIATNQSGIGRGYFTAETLAHIHTKLCDTVTESGGHIACIAHCPHTPDDHCACRKPKPGLLHQISDQLGIALQDAVFIGDKATDVAAAHAAQCQAILLQADPEQTQMAIDAVTPPPPKFPDLASAVTALLSPH